MKRMVPALMVVGLLVLTACSNSDETPMPTLTLSPTALNVNAGGVANTFTAMASNSSETVTWSLGGPGTLSTTTGPSISYTPPASAETTQMAALTATLGATSVTASATIGVYSASVTPPPITEPEPEPQPNPNPGGDKKAPTIASILPENGATGVAADASIVVTFSEEMNEAATEAAYSSEDLPTSAVSFAWSGGGTTLTIKPNAPLEYGIDTVAKTYIFTLSGAATDLAGNKLVEKQYSFSTLRQMQATLLSQAALDGDVGIAYLVYTDLADIAIGDASSNTSSRGFVSFDLSSIPGEVSAEAIQKADLFVHQEGVNGDPFGGLGGAVLLEHVYYGASLIGTAYGTPALIDFGAFDTGAGTGYRTASVVAAVRDDLTKRSERGDRSQYRLRFAQETNGDDDYDLVKYTSGDATSNQPKLELTYLVP